VPKTPTSLELLRSGCETIGEVPAERGHWTAFTNRISRRRFREGKSYSNGAVSKGLCGVRSVVLWDCAEGSGRTSIRRNGYFCSARMTPLEDAATRRSSSRENIGDDGAFMRESRRRDSNYMAGLCGAAPNGAARAHRSAGGKSRFVLVRLARTSMPIDTMCSLPLTAIHEACSICLRNDASWRSRRGQSLSTSIRL